MFVRLGLENARKATRVQGGVELKFRRLEIFNVAHLRHALYGIGSPGLANRFKLECARLCLIILVHPLSRYALCTALSQDRGENSLQAIELPQLWRAAPLSGMAGMGIKFHTINNETVDGRRTPSE